MFTSRAERNRQQLKRAMRRQASVIALLLEEKSDLEAERDAWRDMFDAEQDRANALRRKQCRECKKFVAKDGLTPCKRCGALNWRYLD